MLEGWKISIRLQSNFLNGERVLWKDTPAFDFKERPKTEVFEAMCYYEFTMHFKKTFKTAKQIREHQTPSTSINFTHHDEETLEHVVGINKESHFRGQGFTENWHSTKTPQGTIYVFLQNSYIG